MRDAPPDRRAAHEALAKAFADGRPLESYHASEARALAKAGCGALILAFVSLLGPVLFTLGEPFGVPGGPKGSGPPWVWLAVTPFVVGVFLYLRLPRYILRKLRVRKLAIAVFPEGLVCRTSAGLVPLPWDEIASFERDPTTVELGSEPYGPWFCFVIRGRDGSSVAFEDDDFAGADRLAETIETRLGIRRAVPEQAPRRAAGKWRHRLAPVLLRSTILAALVAGGWVGRSLALEWGWPAWAQLPSILVGALLAAIPAGITAGLLANRWEHRVPS